MAFKNYSFLDQIKDVEIDLTDYLTRFSDSIHTLKFSNLQPVVATIKNIFEKQQLVKDYKEKGASFILHQIIDGELPEDVAIQYYDSEDFWWVVLLFNDIQSPLTEWPLTEDQMEYIANIKVEKENKYTKDAYKQLLFENNESKRSIEILKPAQLMDLISQFRNKFVEEENQTRNFTITI